MNAEIEHALNDRIAAADARYGPFASTHEALGVGLEEWSEFCDAVHENDLPAAAREALDLAAVLIRFAGQWRDPELQRRSVK